MGGSLQPSSTLRILIAEDDKDHQHLLLLALIDNQPDAQVRVVSTGTQLLAALRDHTYDCVVVDFNLPDFRASELVQQAAQDLVATPVVIVSANEDQSTAIESFRCGVIDFVPKSQALQGDALWRSVEHAIGESRRRDAERRERDRRERHLARLAETDQLTGLNNRHYFDRCLTENRWADDRRKRLSLVMIDIDHFKRINDQFGHNAGDDLLRQTADFIVHQASGSDVALRWGGEEFLVIRPSASMTDSLVWAERLRRMIAHQKMRWDGREIQITLSAGVHECAADQLGRQPIEQVDAALYVAKRRGRDQVASSLMVQAGRLITQAVEGPAHTPDERLDHFLKLITPTLGPTQREHITLHAEQVAAIAAQIARVLGLSDDMRRAIDQASRLHDIGKCMVPEEVLAKRSCLTLVERAIISPHATYGAEIAEELGFDAQIIRMIREHHVRYDAFHSGKRMTANVGSRVLCAADALATMLTCRTYQPIKSLVEALREMRQEKGRQFDPDVVDAAHFVESVYALAA
jgi:diguanylate cyclase (GGDEF)-like protein/putative nucleotidyltransferase with HDIG domain